MELFPCPVCGFLSLSEPPGSYEICDICFWEDDIVQLTFPDMAGGANKVSLIEAQKNFIEYGASEKRHIANVWKNVDAKKCESWRPIKIGVDKLLSWEKKGDHEYWQKHKDIKLNLYYWQKDYWLSK